MLIRAYSDLHGFLPHIEPCDLLLIAGDICPIDGEYGDHRPETQARWLKEVFNPWCEAMPVDQIVLIAGNHDAIFEAKFDAIEYEQSEKWWYLFDSSVQIENGPLIFGQPWIPNLARWPFYKTDLELRELADKLPDGHAIWLLHSPPCSLEPDYHLDMTTRGEHVGNPYVTRVIEERGPQLVICGHIHEGFGRAVIGHSAIANASFVNERYVPMHRHIEIDWHDGNSCVARVLEVVEQPASELWWSCR